MSENNFNRSQCITALLKLGFTLKNKPKRRGKHCKYLPPTSIKQNIPAGCPPFIMIPRSRQIHCQKAILDELEKMGGKKLLEDFLNLI